MVSVQDLSAEAVFASQVMVISTVLPPVSPPLVCDNLHQLSDEETVQGTLDLIVNVAVPPALVKDDLLMPVLTSSS